LKTGGGRPLPPHLKAQITRELDRLELLLGQIEAVEIERDALLSAMKPDGMNADAVRSPPAMLINLNGIGPEIAAVLWSEGLYRSFANRKQVAAYAGLAPTPWQSGSVAREHRGFQSGQSKAADNIVATCLAMAAPPAAISAGALVPRARHAQRRAPAAPSG
jgi:transposase